MRWALATGLLVGLAYRLGARKQHSRELARAIRWYAQGAQDTLDALEPDDDHVAITAEHLAAQVRAAEQGWQ